MTGKKETRPLPFRFGVLDLSRRLSPRVIDDEAQKRSLAEILLLALGVVGAAFLVMYAGALGSASCSPARSPAACTPSPWAPSGCARATSRPHHGAEPRPARRAGGVLQLHVARHRGPARAAGREGADGGGAAHRPPDPDEPAARRSTWSIERAARSPRSACPRTRWAATTTTSCPSPNHRLGVLIADVSGKGTSAALYMAELKGLILSLSRIYDSPKRAADRGQPHPGRRTSTRRSFITMTYAIVDSQKRTLRVARAGHNPLIHFEAAPGRRASLSPPGLGLGFDSGDRFKADPARRSRCRWSTATRSCSSPTASPRP